MSETPNIQVQEADPMPEPTPTYTLEDFQKAIVRELRILERWCPDPTCPEAADIRDTIRLLTFAQGLAQQIPMLKQLLAESRERNESLTRALAAKTQELAESRAELAETDEEFYKTTQSLGVLAAEREAAEQQFATVRGELFEVVSTLGADMGRAADAGYAGRGFSHLREAVVRAMKELQRIALLGDGPGPAPTKGSTDAAV